MTMDYHGARYTGALLFDDNVSCEQMYKLLQRCCGLLTLDIGNLDVPLDFDLVNIYRKALACQTWHFCTNCSHWPAEDFEQLTILPESGQLCNECKTLREARNCQ